MSSRPPALILDFDASVLKFSDDEIRIPLHDRQEHFRFGCSKSSLSGLEEQVGLPAEHGCVFLGSGDYHHLSLLLLKKIARKYKKFDVVVCDNHPDNMRYPFGIHCGSWIFHASGIPEIGRIHVVGITSDDITVKHCLENCLSPLRNGRVTYWSVGRKAHWLALAGAKKAHRDFDAPGALLDAFAACVADSRHIYLSLDKDVFAKDVAETNWDQGCFAFEHFETLLAACGDRLVGMDVTGEISAYRFRGLFKRALAWWDGIKQPERSRLGEWQEKHRLMNGKIVQLLEKTGGKL